MIQMSTETKNVVDLLKTCGLLQTKGLIGGKWTDAYDGKTIQVFNIFCFQLILIVKCIVIKLILSSNSYLIIDCLCVFTT